MDVDERVGAGERDVRPEERRQDLDAPGEAFERLGGDGLADRPEEAVALAVGDRAADDDPVRVEGVDVPDAGRRRTRAGRVHQRRAGRVAGVLAGRDVERRERVHADDRRARRPGMRRALASTARPGVAGEGDPARDRLDVADPAAAAARPVELTETWPSSPAMPSGPWSSLPPLTIAAADSGRDGHVDEVVDVRGRRRRRLAEGGDVCVAIEVGRQAEGGLDVAAIGMSRKPGPRLGGLDDRPRRVDRPGRRDADPGDRPRRPRGRRARAPQRRDTGRDDGRRSPGDRRPGGPPGESAAVGRITAARTWVPPRSRARTGGTGELGCLGKAGLFYQSRDRNPRVRAGRCA